jgi:hypothetical protein
LGDDGLLDKGLTLIKIRGINHEKTDLVVHLGNWTFGNRRSLGDSRGLIKDGLEVFRVFIVWFKTRAFALRQRNE